jgi:hypothetical protein
MIKTIFPVNILVKDYELPDSFSDDLSASIQAIFQVIMLENQISKEEAGDNEFPVFTEENMQTFPALRELRKMFVDGFYELASSFEGNTLTRENIETMVHANVGKLPLMQKGDYKRLHNHVNAVAFGIFYLSDVDNNKNGGKLILKDPSFHSNFSFHPPSDYEVETKKNRLVVAPGYIWHEVTPYLGDEDRITVVVNLHLDNM